MPNFNTTGIPTQDYLLGRGCVFLSLLDANDEVKGFRAMGNCTEFKLTPKANKLEHYNSCGGIKVKDAEVITEISADFSIKCDELTLQNIAVFLEGEASGSVTNPAVAGFAEYLMVKDGNLALGVHYPIVTSAGIRVAGVDKTKVIVKTNEAVPVPLVEGTDFITDEANGSIFIVASSTVVATAIGTGDGLLVTLTADATAPTTLATVKGLTQSPVKYAVLFKGINPNDGNKEYTATVYKSILMPSGDMGLITDKAFSELAFGGGLQKSNSVEATANGGYFLWNQVK